MMQKLLETTLVIGFARDGEHAPIPLRVENDVIAVPRLNVPRGDSWWDNEDWRIGKKFALPEFDHGRQLRMELEELRTFWAERDSVVRAGEAWSNATLEKRVREPFVVCTRLTSICLKLSRALLYLGFLALVRAIKEPKDLTLSACLNRRSVLRMEYEGTPGAELEHCREFVGRYQVMIGGFVWCF